ncbi:MAG: class I SAM-dependent methyltransferase [Acidimicrobiales bacterium]
MKPADRMRRFWDERARENAAWYVDTTLSYDDPDMERFFANGRIVVEEALLKAPVQPERHEVALEIGPGLGRICAALADHFDRVIGLDVSEEMMARARDHVTDPRIDFLVGDGVTLQPVDDASIDFVTSFTVLQHLTSTDLVLGYFREAARVLRPGGVLALQWNNLPHPSLWRLRARWWRVRARLGLGMRNENRNAPEFVGTRVPWEPIKSTLEDCGLQIRGRRGEDTLFSWVWATR